jgi:hypothetical protein
LSNLFKNLRGEVWSAENKIGQRRDDIISNVLNERARIVQRVPDQGQVLDIVNAENLSCNQIAQRAER